MTEPMLWARRGYTFSLLLIQSTKSGLWAQCCNDIARSHSRHLLRENAQYLCTTYSFTHKDGTGGNSKRLRNSNWRCYQAESTRRQAFKRSIRFSLAQASLRQTPKKTEISQRLCVCENSSAIVLSVTDSLIVFDSTHTFCQECWVKPPLLHQGVKP